MRRIVFFLLKSIFPRLSNMESFLSHHLFRCFPSILFFCLWHLTIFNSFWTGFQILDFLSRRNYPSLIHPLPPFDIFPAIWWHIWILFCKKVSVCSHVLIFPKNLYLFCFVFFSVFGIFTQVRLDSSLFFRF